MACFFYLLLLCELMFTWLIYYVFMCTFLWWTFLYLHLLIIKKFDGLINTPTSPWTFFSISTTSLSPSLYIRDFFGFICLLTSPWRAYAYMKLFWSYVLVRTSGDLFCTHTFSCWPILYIWNFLIAYFLHTPDDLFSVSITTSWPSLYTSEFNSMIIYFYLVSLWLRDWYFIVTCTYLWWPIL